MLSILVPEGSSLFEIDAATCALFGGQEYDENSKPGEVVGWVQQVQIRGSGEKTEIWYEIGCKSSSVGLGDALDIWVPASAYRGPFQVVSKENGAGPLGDCGAMCVRVGWE